MSEHGHAWKTRLKNLRDSHDDAVRRLHREARRRSRAEADLEAERERVRQMSEATEALRSTNGYLTGLRASLAWARELDTNVAAINLRALEECLGEVRQALAATEPSEAGDSTHPEQEDR